MKTRVRLYGTLRQRQPAGGQTDGMEIEIPEGTTAGDLLHLLGILEPQGVVVIMDGRVLALDDEVRGGSAVAVFQAIGGGQPTG